MLFAASRPEIGALMGIAQPQATGVVGGMMQEQNKICLQTDPPQCFDASDPFEQAESGGITNKVFDKSLTREGGFKPPSPSVDMDIREILRRNEEKFKAGVPELEDPDFVQELLNKAEVAETWNEGTGIEKGGYENAPQWLRDQLWKQDLRKRQELGLEPVAS
jgi:hypothetical protein